MYTTQAPLYIILVIVFLVIGLIVCSFIISVLSHQSYLRRYQRSRGETEIITLEKERKRIAADIHDELGPLLSAAKLKYSEVQGFSKEDEKFLNRGHQLIDDIISKMRLIAKDLMPTVLLYKGLELAIREFISQATNDSNLFIEFKAVKIPELSEFQDLHIYRILQEIILNTLKHAAATRIKIKVFTWKNKLVISTIDNGKGFHYKNKMREGRGLGLYNLQSRAEILNGKVQVSSKINLGTKFCITIPL